MQLTVWQTTGEHFILNWLSIQDSLRLKVESELDLARSKIEAITKQIEIASSASVPTPVESRFHIRAEASRMKGKLANVSTNGGDKGVSVVNPC